MARTLALPCSDCHQKFGGQETFDRHRYIAGDVYRCRDEAELAYRGFYRDRWNIWHRGPNPAQTSLLGVTETDRTPSPLPQDTAAVQRATVARREATLQARFETFDAENPRVYDLLVRFARQLRGRGYEHVGISLIWERMRWELAIETVDPDGFKLNNDWRSRYSRKIMREEPDLEGLFRTRLLRAV